MLSRLYILLILLMVLLAGCTHPPQTPPQTFTDDCPCSPDHPSPFSPPPCMHYVVDDSSFVRLVVFATSGQPVDTLVNGFQQPGEQCVVWSVPDSVKSGVYFFRLTIGETRTTKVVIW